MFTGKGIQRGWLVIWGVGSLTALLVACAGEAPDLAADMDSSPDDMSVEAEDRFTAMNLSPTPDGGAGLIDGGVWDGGIWEPEIPDGGSEPPESWHYADSDGDAPFTMGCVWEFVNDLTCSRAIPTVHEDRCLDEVRLHEQLTGNNMGGTCPAGQCCPAPASAMYDCDFLCRSIYGSGDGGVTGGDGGVRRGVCESGQERCSFNPVARCRCL
jgi:hypothetical protein